MEFNFKTTADFFDYFKDEKTCYEFLEKQWWKNEIVCPHCGTIKEPYKVKSRYGKDKNVPAYKCSEKECNLSFTVKTKSIFEGTKIELRKWFHAIYEIQLNKKGISSITLSNKIFVSQKTSWLMLHKIRNTQKEDEQEKFEGTNQIDETFVGGKNKNRHHDKKVKNSQGRSFKDKTPVLGILNEGEFEIIERQNKVFPSKKVKEKFYTKPNKVKLFVVSDTSSNSIQPLLYKNIKKDSIVLTDEWMGYNGINSYFEHHICDHSKGQYTNGFATTNKVENFWSIFKRGIIGIYHFVSRKHLKLYCNEFESRYNNRSLELIDRFTLAINLSLKERVTYAYLTRSYPKINW